eukprot:6480929-Amphidinium_carterae.1
MKATRRSSLVDHSGWLVSSNVMSTIRLTVKRSADVTMTNAEESPCVGTGGTCAFVSDKKQKAPVALTIAKVAREQQRRSSTYTCNS